MYVSLIQNNNFYTQKFVGNNKYQASNGFCLQFPARKKSQIFFGNSDSSGNFYKWLKSIKDGFASILGVGWQGTFYQVTEKTGMKVPTPKHPEYPGADANGYNNVKEKFILDKLYGINPEIAPKPVDLGEKDGKYYLLTQIIKGKHPVASGLTVAHTKGIINKIFQMDINGIVNTDLQARNIILEANSSEKIIDFGYFNILNNEGYYIDSNGIDFKEFYPNCFMDSQTNATPDVKFIKTFFTEGEKFGVKNYSDNPHLRIMSNISNFEFRTLYDYLMAGKQENPVEFFKQYLKIKSECYHSKMADFLSRLRSPNQNKQTQIDKAVEYERMFKELFENPSEAVINTELGKIQLKWLANDADFSKNRTLGIKKVQMALQDFIQQTQKYQAQSNGNEKEYFKGILTYFQDFLRLESLKEKVKLPLSDNSNILKVLHRL